MRVLVHKGEYMHAYNMVIGMFFFYITCLLVCFLLPYSFGEARDRQVGAYWVCYKNSECYGEVVDAAYGHCCSKGGQSTQLYGITG